VERRGGTGRCGQVSLADTGQRPPVAPQGTTGAALGTNAGAGTQATNGGGTEATGGGTEGHGGAPSSGERLGWLLAVCCAAQFMVILDLSIVNVALPSIQASLNFSSTQLQWVVDAYAIVFAGFLMLGGRAADYLGQRRSWLPHC
jgi:hypothetical protein